MMPGPARRTLAVVAVLGAGALLPAACGTSRSGLTPVEQSQLLGMIAQARAAAAAGNPAGAEASLTSLRAAVSQLRTSGSLDPTRAARMQSVAAQAQSAARTQAAAKAAASAAPAATPAPAPNTPPAARTPPASTGAGPAQIVVQGADALKNRVDQAVGKGVAKLKKRIDHLQQNLAGQAQGKGNGGGGGD